MVMPLAAGCSSCVKTLIDIFWQVVCLHTATRGGHDMISHQGKQATIKGKFTQIYHTFALFDAPRMGKMIHTQSIYCSIPSLPESHHPMVGGQLVGAGDFRHLPFRR